MIPFFLAIPNDLAALDQISWGDAITTKIGSVEIGMGSIFYLDIRIFQDQDEQRKSLGQVRDLEMNVETCWDASGRIEELVKS